MRFCELVVYENEPEIVEEIKKKLKHDYDCRGDCGHTLYLVPDRSLSGLGRLLEAQIFVLAHT
jgi:hypothetical protein